MKTRTLYLFSGLFGSIEAAGAYCERDWGEAPSDDASPQQWEAWENEFPKWKFREELDVYLDEDFMEFHFGSERVEALEELLALDLERQNVESLIENDDTLIVLDDNALGDFPAELKSTYALRFLGAYVGRA